METDTIAKQLENAQVIDIPIFKNKQCSLIKWNNVNIIFDSKDFVKLNILLTKKGDCSTNESIDKIVYGTAYSSHALPFHLYNYSALKVIDTFVNREQMKDMTFVELGCNNGLISRMLNRNGYKFKEYFGVDFDFSFIVDGLSEFNENDNLFPSNFITGDFNKPLIFEDSSVDFVYFQEAFDHCRDKLFYSERLLYEINRILKDNGLLYITLVFEHTHRDLYHWDHNYTWSKQEFEDVVSNYFDIINFNSLLTFEETLIEQSKTNPNIKNTIDNWPTKLAKQFCAPFVGNENSAVGSYLLKKR
jgi:SAM-dependent methyltransferase